MTGALTSGAAGTALGSVKAASAVTRMRLPASSLGILALPWGQRLLSC